FFLSSRRRHTRSKRDWSSDVCSSDLVFLYRMVMLLDKTTTLEPTVRVDRAFRYDVQEDKKEEFAANMDLFHSYVRGGIEEMYERSEERRVGNDGSDGWVGDE